MLSWRRGKQKLPHDLLDRKGVVLFQRVAQMVIGKIVGRTGKGCLELLDRSPE